MATIPTNNPPCVVMDANVLIAVCAKEASKSAVAHAQMEQYAQDGWQFFAPGVLVAETLYILCGKEKIGLLSPAQHTQAIQDFQLRMKGIQSPPNGDASLITRAEQIRRTYGCSRSADGLYIALAEELAQTGTAELVTFDADLQKQAVSTAPTVTVRLLTP